MGYHKAGLFNPLFLGPRWIMNRRTRLLSAYLLVSSFTGVAICRAERVYRLVDNPASQEGHFLNGTITTTNDAANDSSLDLAEILGWQWSVSGPHSFAASSQDFLNNTSIAIGVRITNQAISLPVATLSTPGPFRLSLSRETPMVRGAFVHSLFWSSLNTPSAGTRNIYSASYLQSDAILSFWSGNATFPSNSGWLIAVAVPEPSTVVLIVLAAMVAPIRRLR
jgi:hypothetical protein